MECIRIKVIRRIIDLGINEIFTKVKGITGFFTLSMLMDRFKACNDVVMSLDLIG